MESAGGASARGFAFQHYIATLYRSLGAEVETEAALAGNAIDILAREKTPSGEIIRTAIETKMYSKPLGARQLHSFAAVVNHLKQRGLVDRGVLVAAAGYTAQAREEAGKYSIELVDPDELEKRVSGEGADVKAPGGVPHKEQAPASAAGHRPKKIFVLMPFSEAFDDVYIIGIREVAEQLGYVVERADDIEHNQDVLAVLQDQIRTADVVIADTTTQNPNVFYEVGYAHASDKPTILISRQGEKIPFDLQSLNHIFYSTIVDLRTRLTKRLEAMFGVSRGKP
ncbi:restriction endonuclease [Longimicrobium sp.]|uniref:restriction endonuclease n=1 Tax=Longimicrobium sp. TaxID=2029185 RepID=UPI003B3AE004